MWLETQKEMVIWLQGLSNAFTDLFFNFISFFGEPEFYILLLGFIYWIYNKKAGEFIGLTLGLSLSLNNVFKGIFNVERPFLTHPEEIQNMRASTATGSSFPSGHVQGATTIFFAVATYFKQRWLFIVAAVMIILMMISRMYLGVHYLQDVIAGGIIGIGITLGMYKAFTMLYENQQRLHQFYIALAVILFPAILLIDVNDFFRGYGIMVGFILAIIFEKHYINFTLDVSRVKLALRYVVGVGAILITMIALGELFSLINTTQGSLPENMLDFVRFFAVAFIGFGVYPYIFNRFNF